MQQISAFPGRRAVPVRTQVEAGQIDRHSHPHGVQRKRRAVPARLHHFSGALLAQGEKVLRQKRRILHVNARGLSARGRQVPDA